MPAPAGEVVMLELDEQRALEMIDLHPAAFLLLARVACAPGALIKGPPAGMTRQSYRGAREYLERNQMAIFQSFKPLGIIGHLDDNAPFQHFMGFVKGNRGGEPLRNLCPVSQQLDMDGLAITKQGGGTIEEPLKAGACPLPPSPPPDPPYIPHPPRTPENTKYSGERERGGVEGGLAAGGVGGGASADRPRATSPAILFRSLVRREARFERLRGPEVIDLYGRWVAYRREARFPLTTDTVSRDAAHMLTILDGGGTVATIQEAFETAMDRGYRGWFFPDKHGAKNTDGVRIAQTGSVNLCELLANGAKRRD
jgi:hypothetical protein